MDFSARNLMGNGSGDGTGSCPEVHHLGRGHSRDVINDQLDHRFRFRTGNDDTRPHAQLKMAEIRDAGDVLEGDPSGTLLHQFPVAFRSGRVAEQHGTQAAKADTEQVFGKQLGIDTRAGHTGFG
ncbi:hypothetical protein D3C73_1439370 [compost metagenome]